MSDNNIPTENNQIPHQDPVIEFLSKLQFNTNIFEQLDKADKDPELYTYFMQVPDIYVLKNMLWIIGEHDPNVKGLGKQDHDAWHNLLKWLLIKMMTDPQWTSYIGHFGRLYGSCQNQSSYYPIKYSPRFTPHGFFVKGEPVNMKEENERITDAEDEFAPQPLKPQEEAFAWKE